MDDIFRRVSSHWVRYSKYEFKEARGSLYLVPAKKAKPIIYDPLKNAETMIVDALNVGMAAMNRASDDVMKQAVLDFVSKYGLLGFMTALPTTPMFMDYGSVYFPKNHFITDESLKTQEFVELFYPLNKPDFQKDERTMRWSIADDREMFALAMTMSDRPMAYNMCLGRDYAERYDWLARQFKDWAFTFSGAFMYYNDYDDIDEYTRNLYRQGMAAFGGVAPTYHIELLDKPTIVWDFHSLLLGVQMMFSFMLTNENKPLRLCKHCVKVFSAVHHNAVFCSHKCKNQYNVYKSRGKK